MIKRILFIVLILFTQAAAAQTDTVRVRTSAQCETCRHKLERDLGYLKGVREISLDLETSVLTVIFDGKRTNEEKIRKAINRSGYDADEMPADPRAYERLPACCKKDGHSAK